MSSQIPATRPIMPPLPESEALGLLAIEEATEYESPRLSPLERLLAAIESHVEGEADALKAYHELAETTPDPIVKFLLRLVLEDEQRHHTLLHRIGTTLEDGLNWSHSPDALPVARESGDAANVNLDQAIKSVRGFIEDERADARQLQELARRSVSLTEGLDTILLETMALDSQKHERIMRFILQRLEQARHQAAGHR